MGVVGDCCFDRTEASHWINLFDMHQKYAGAHRPRTALEYFALVSSEEGAGRRLDRSFTGRIQPGARGGLRCQSRERRPTPNAVIGLRGCAGRQDRVSRGRLLPAVLAPRYAGTRRGLRSGAITLGLATVVALPRSSASISGPARSSRHGPWRLRRNVPNVRFEVANVYELPFADASFRRRARLQIADRAARSGAGAP